MTIRAIIFDLDDTLTDDTASMKQSITEAAAFICRRHPNLSQQVLFDTYWRKTEAFWTAFSKELQKGLATKGDTGYRLRMDSWRQTLLSCGIEDDGLVEQVVKEYARLREETLQLSAGAAEILEKLRGSYRTAIITNGPIDLQGIKLKQLGLQNRVDLCVISEEFGVGKPNPAIFLHVAEKFGAKPKECLMVGDSLSMDIAVANAAGMPSVWLNRNEQNLNDDSPKPEYIIKDIRELIRIFYPQISQIYTDRKT